MIAADLFTALQNMYLADSVAGGLANSSAAEYVRNFVRADDPNDRSLNWPLIRVEIIEQEGDAFGKNRIGAVVRFHLFTELQPGLATQNVIVTRMRTVFHQKVPTASSAWEFGELAMRGGSQAPADKTELHYVIPALLGARKV